MLSRALRCGLFIAPILASLAVATVISHLLPRATSWQTGMLCIVVVSGLSLVTLVLFERAARKLLPLAALLNVSLIFPDKAPKRFAMARRVGTPKDLQERLRQARARGEQGDASALQSVAELVLALSVHDKATRGHSERVRVYTELIADELKLDAQARNKLRWAALLHDIGKLEVPVAVLNKTEPLTDDDWQHLHKHPEHGARLIQPLLPWLGEWGDAVVQHHERYDGTGYPRGLGGKRIGLAARIVSVADVYEVMTAPRPYRRPMSVTAARRELTRVAGTQLDPDIVRAFLNVSVGRLWRVIGFAAWVGQLPALARIFDGLGNWAASGTATLGAVVVGISTIATPVPLPTHVGYGTALQVTAAPATPSATAKATAPAPLSRPSSAPRPKPAPQRATPHAASVPACPGCTNSSSKCTSHCDNDNLPHCTAYCEGNNNPKCRTYCFGNNNPKCTSSCYGTNNASCHSTCPGKGRFQLNAYMVAPAGASSRQQSYDSQAPSPTLLA